MKQRLLLMLDEFPQLGNLKSMELALAVCAGYGIKVCIAAQDVNQLNKEYTKDNSIASNCHVHIYFTPNLDSGAATAESISKNLGKKTISTVIVFPILRACIVRWVDVNAINFSIFENILQQLQGMVIIRLNQRVPQIGIRRIAN